MKPPTPAREIIVLRYGELFLKGGNRHLFERQLERNVDAALAGIEAVSTQRAQGRLYVDCPPGCAEAAAARLRRVFGISSLSIAHRVDPDLEAICAGAIRLAGEIAPSPKSFKVETRRADKSFPMRSPEISREVGHRVIEATGWRVDVHQPALVIGVEIGRVRSFVHAGRIPGAGGLPVGCEGEVLLLLSGGIDSPVAGHLMQKRGCRLRALYFHSPPYTSERARDKVLQLASRLARAQARIDVDMVDFAAIQCDIRDNAHAELAVVLYRRSMLRIASAIARRKRCGALASGESLGQVASQTLQNLACINEAATLPMLRPLIAYDKIETITLARAIGTYEISIQPHADCCSLFVPKHPATRTTVERARRAEASLDAALETQAIDTAETVRVLWPH